MANLPINHGAGFGVPPPAPIRRTTDTMARTHQPRPNGRHSLMSAPVNRTEILGLMSPGLWEVGAPFGSVGGGSG